VVPFIPGLRAFWDPAGEGFTFKARDIVVQDMSSILPRQIRAVGIYAGFGCRAGGALPGSTVNNYRIGGMYLAPTATTGMIIMHKPPSFLNDSTFTWLYSGQVTQIRGNVFHPGSGSKPTTTPSSLIQQDAKNMMNIVARVHYITDVLKNRWGDITTAVRFDVAPGSSVKIEGTSGSFMGTGEDRYGQVVRVAHYFDAQQQRCGTSFRLANMHTATEHTMDKYSISNHPYYTTTYTGAKHMLPH
jgi:hypothetical protein